MTLRSLPWPIRLAIALAATYALIVAILTSLQGRFFFHPNPRRADLSSAGLVGFSTQVLTTSDGERLVAWWRPPVGRAGVVLYLHGNADNLSVLSERLRDVAATGAGVLAIDYRGYGGSTGAPSEQGLYRDARAAWSFIRHEAPSRPVAIWGESIGTAVAVQLATEVDEAGVVLDSPFASMTRLAARGAPWFPAPLVQQRFDTERKIGRIGSPLLIAHCIEDRTVPIAEGRRAYDAAREPKRFIALPGCGHVDTWREPAKAAILEFLHERIGAAAGSAI